MATAALASAILLLVLTAAYFHLLRRRWFRSPWVSEQPEDAWIGRLSVGSGFACVAFFLCTGAVISDAIGVSREALAPFTGLAGLFSLWAASKGIEGVERAVRLQAARDGDVARGTVIPRRD